MKKAQIGLFLVIGVVLILAALAVFLFVTRVGPDDVVIEDVTELPTYVQPVRLYVDKCLEKTLEDSLLILGHQGGFILFTPEEYFRSEYGKQAVLIEGNNTYLPTIEEMETETGVFIDLTLEECLNDFKTFTDQGYIIDAEQSLTEVEFLDKGAVATTGMKLRITKGVSTAEINGYTASSDIRIKHMHGLVEQTIEDASTSQSINHGLLASFDVTAETIPAMNLEPILFYHFTDKESKTPLSFLFAARIQT